MNYKPYDYQLYAIRFIKEHPALALLLDMGLGKTSITLTALHELLFDSFEIHRVLVIAPMRVARDIWPAEVKKWDHLKDLTVSTAVGSEAKRLAALKKQADIYIINRENVQWLVESSGIPFDFDTVIIDELSGFKNYRSKRFQALLKVRPGIKRIVGLTGTPSSNGLMDLWAEMRLIDEGKRLGRYVSQFRAKYFVSVTSNGNIIFGSTPIPGAEQEIYNKIGDITVSMKSDDYLNMPALVRSDYKVSLSPKEFVRYRTLEQELFLKLPDGEITVKNAGVLCGKLCQMANGAIYDTVGACIRIHDRKLDALEDIIESACGKPLLVAYWYRHDLERITERLDRLKIRYAKLDTSGSINAWNAGELPVGLIHPASAGHGLNLQSGGACLVWFSLTWSLELYQQTNARLWRQGQSAETVVIEHIIVNDTIDEDILSALARKETSQDALINAVKAHIGA